MARKETLESLEKKLERLKKQYKKALWNAKIDFRSREAYRIKAKEVFQKLNEVKTEIEKIKEME